MSLNCLVEELVIAMIDLRMEATTLSEDVALPAVESFHDDGCFARCKYDDPLKAAPDVDAMESVFDVAVAGRLNMDEIP
jgi:hypothetical protein